MISDDFVVIGSSLEHQNLIIQEENLKYSIKTIEDWQAIELH